MRIVLAGIITLRVRFIFGDRRLPPDMHGMGVIGMFENSHYHWFQNLSACNFLYSFMDHSLRVDKYLTLSKHVAGRIQKYYGRSSGNIPPC
jgi:hypothetical protein